MEQLVFILCLALVGIGVYASYLINALSGLKQQLSTAHEMILQLAQECQDLGSTNVKVFSEDSSK